MSILHNTRHWLLPLPFFLLGLSAATSADTYTNATVSAADAAIPQDIRATSNVTLQADEDGDLYLRVGSEHLSAQSGKLQDALLEVLLNGESITTRPLQVDDEGKVHYLVRLGQDESGAEIRLTPVSEKTPLSSVLSNVATSSAALLSLGVADLISYNSWVNKGHIGFGTLDDDSFTKALTRNYLKQGILISSFGYGDAITDGVKAALPESNDDGRTTWQDLLPDAISTVAMASASNGLRYVSDAPRMDMTHTLIPFTGLFFTSSTTNSLANFLTKTHEVVLNDLTSMDQTKVKYAAKIAPILESAVFLALAKYTGQASLDRGNGSSWARGVLPASLATTATYSLRGLVSDAITEYTDGNRTVGDLAAGSIMAGSAIAGHGLMHVLNNCFLDTHSYGDLLYKMSAESAGLSLGFGIQGALKSLLGSSDPNHLPTRLASTGSVALAGILLQVAAFHTGNYPATQALLRSAGDGALIANTIDMVTLARDTIVEPWIIKPLLAKAGMGQKSDGPALSLRATAVPKRQPLQSLLL